MTTKLFSKSCRPYEGGIAPLMKKGAEALFRVSNRLDTR